MLAALSNLYFKQIKMSYELHKIQNIHAREVLDSRGNPTVEVEVSTENYTVSSIVPSGASTGVHEALELRDGDPKRYLGRGVQKAVDNVNKIIKPALIGTDIYAQQKIDAKLLELDGTPNKANLGANAILGVSLSVAKAAAKERNQHLFERYSEIAMYMNISTEARLLPTPMMNVINGGVHADSGLEIQEFMIMPTGANSFKEALQIGAEIFHTLKKILKKQGMTTAVGDEGGFAPRLENNEAALQTLMDAIEQAGYTDKVELALDCAASEFYEDGFYLVGGSKLTADDLVSYYANLIEKYPIVSIEDPFDEDDFEAWQAFTAKVGDKVQVVGDDLFVTNPERVKMGIEKGLANSILIKLNQIGTVTETIETINLGNSQEWTSVVSHRSGESEDTTIADLAVGLGTGQIKTGSLSRTDRIAKYNQLLRIEEILGEKAQYQGNIR